MLSLGVGWHISWLHVQCLWAEAWDQSKRGRDPRLLWAAHLLAFLPSVWGLPSVSASLSSSVGLWGSERGNAVFKVSTIAFTTICKGQESRVRHTPMNRWRSYQKKWAVCFNFFPPMAPFSPISFYMTPGI